MQVPARGPTQRPGQRPGAVRLRSHAQKRTWLFPRCPPSARWPAAPPRRAGLPAGGAGRSRGHWAMEQGARREESARGWFSDPGPPTPPRLGSSPCFVLVDASVNIALSAALAPRHVTRGREPDLPVFTLHSDVA